VKEKYKHKRLLGFASVLMATVLLAACNAEKNPALSESNESAPTNSTSTEAPKESEKTVKISMFNSLLFSPTQVPPTNKADDPLRALLEKSANIDLEISFVPPDQAMNKLNTLIASGDIPDLMFMPDRETAVQFYDQGIIADVDSVLNDYPALKANYTEDTWNSMKYKGKILGTPGYEPVQAIRGLWIRNDWLQNLKLEVPTTPDELLNVMTAFTNNDPDGNGKNDTYGYVMAVGKTGSLKDLGIENLMLMYGVSPGGVDAKDGELLYNNTDPRMKEAISFINRMLTAKVVDPDWVAINDTAGIADKFVSGKVGIVHNDWRSYEVGNQKTIQEVTGGAIDWKFIPPMKGPHGDQISAVFTPQTNFWAISAKAAKEPEKVKRIMTMLQYWYADKEAYPTFAYGLEGNNWNMVDGKPVINQANKLDKELQTKIGWMSNYANVRRATDGLYFNFTNPDTVEYLKLNQQYLKPLSVDNYITPDPADMLWNDRIKFMNESMLKFIVGKDSLDNWDAYLKTLDSKYAFQNYLGYIKGNLQDQGYLK